MAAQISCFRNHDNTRHKATSEMKKDATTRRHGDFSSAVILDYKAHAWWMCIHSSSHRPRNSLGVIHAVQGDTFLPPCRAGRRGGRQMRQPTDNFQVIGGSPITASHLVGYL
jgi:hypothetical protein